MVIIFPILRISFPVAQYWEVAELSHVTCVLGGAALVRPVLEEIFFP